MKKLNKCPVCGSKIEYHDLCQYEDVYEITRSAKMARTRKRKTDIGPIECGFLACSKEGCKFITNCDYELPAPINGISYKIKDELGVFYYEGE